MADTEDRTSISSAAEALQRAREDVANLTVEGDESRRSRLISLLNTVGDRLGEIGDRITERDSRDGDVDRSGKVVTEDSAPRNDTSPADARKARR
jgi:hypothetical protein